MKVLAGTLTAAVLVAMGGPVQAVPVLSFTPGSGNPAITSQNFSLGWSFTTTQESVVIALDAFEPSANGSEVRLYNGGGVVLASATVTTADPQEGTPLFYSQSIAPVTLAANTTYYIVQDVPFSGEAVYQVTDLVTIPAIMYDGPVSALDLGQNPIDDIFVGQLSPGYFGPNFDVALPEPASALVLGAGVTVMGLFRRRRA